MDDLKIGDEAWFPRTAPRQVREPCPLCSGNPAHTVTVILADGTEVATPCGYCGHGFDGPRGFTTEYEHDPAAERVRVHEVRIEESLDGRSVRYGLDTGWCAEPGDLFPTEAAALAEARRRLDAEEEAKDERRRHRKGRAVAQALWDVGYHLREAKEHRRKLAYHEGRAVELRRRNAVDKEQKQPHD